jgi:hypothetical protein
MVFEGEHLVFLRKPILSCGTRQALPHVPLTNNEHKYTNTGHSLPEFCLQNTCKFAIQSAAWLTALATRATPQNAKVLKHLFPLVPQSQAIFGWNACQVADAVIEAQNPMKKIRTFDTVLRFFL